MGIFSQYDSGVLSRYKKRARVRPEDQKVLDYWSSIGFVSEGFNWDEDYPTAKISDMCSRHL